MKGYNVFLFIITLIIVGVCDLTAEKKINTVETSSFSFFNTDIDNNSEKEIDDWLPSPARAAMLSATLPGFGQIYNKQYWKVPIIYAGFGALVYFIDMNTGYYQTYRTAYFYRVDENPHTTDHFPNYSTDVLHRAMNHYRRNLELNYVLVAALYILNILDASVDAHLMDFDISEDLTMNITPAFERTVHSTKYSTGLKFSINF